MFSLRQRNCSVSRIVEFGFQGFLFYFKKMERRCVWFPKDSGFQGFQFSLYSSILYFNGKNVVI